MGVFRAEMRAAEFVREEIAEADAGACVIETGATDAGETRTKNFELGGSGHILKAQDLASEELVLRMGEESGSRVIFFVRRGA